MMSILQKKNNFIFFIFIISLFLPSCQAFFPVEPIKNVNDKFEASYKNTVGKAKRKHYDSIKKSNYDGDVNIENTAYGRLRQREIDFLEYNEKNNPYIYAERAGDTNLSYLSYNAGPYVETQKNIFDSIIIPNNDFKYYNLGEKEFNEINNIELQEAYDYMKVINYERLKQIEILRLREEEIKHQNAKGIGSVLDKTKTGLKNLTDKIRGLLN